MIVITQSLHSETTHWFACDIHQSLDLIVVD